MEVVGNPCHSQGLGKARVISGAGAFATLTCTSESLEYMSKQRGFFPHLVCSCHKVCVLFKLLLCSLGISSQMVLDNQVIT